MLNALIAEAQKKLDAARRELRSAVVDFDLTDEQILELRANARRVYNELAELDRKKLKRGIFGFLGF